MSTDAAAVCPMRKLSRPGERLAPAVEHVSDGERGPRWVIRSHEVARQAIRAEDAVVQAGFGAASMPGRAADGELPYDRKRQAGAERMRSPILYLEGPDHRSQRKAAARFFAPKVVESYRPMMQRLADTLLAPLSDGRPVDLPRVSMRMAVEVAARVIGLTSSSITGMSRRLDAFFEGDLTAPVRTPADVITKVRTSTAMLRFYYLDVRPAIRARRRKPQEDVISQLLAVGYRPLEILTECVTYGAAGMVTTREFISVVTWHLLDDPALLARYRAADVDGRLAVLHEILRLEPVVGHLYRRTVEPMSIMVDGVEQELPVGTLLDLDIRAINADAALVGAEPVRLVPDRVLSARGVLPSVMSFGDGNHRCPGAPIAIMETEIFVSRLVEHDIEISTPPTVTWSDLSEGYELRDFSVHRRSVTGACPFVS